MLGSDRLEVLGEIGLGHGRQHRDAILVTLAAPDDELVGGELDVLDAESAALEDPQPGAVEQARHEVWHPVESVEHGTDLVAGKDDRETRGPLCAHDAIEPGKVDLQHVPVRNRRALRAWFWVEAATRPSTASEERKRGPPAPPSRRDGAWPRRRRCTA
jgi:hypothetical protein